jgi:hypothetical protein
MNLVFDVARGLHTLPLDHPTTLGLQLVLIGVLLVLLLVREGSRMAPVAGVRTQRLQAQNIVVIPLLVAFGLVVGARLVLLI